jgi:xanthine dehydrogenase YagT iron-sulfur-binding subunit
MDKFLSRRGFLGAAGAGAAEAMAPPATAVQAGRKANSGELTWTTLRVNGREHKVAVEPRWNLLYVLRDKLGLTAAKPGCERGECGACTVLIDGQARYSCMTLALEAEGAEITTLEGLMKGEELGPVQRAFVEKDGMQCGFCTPGQIVAAEALLNVNPHPTPEQVRDGMAGNLCRCGAYEHIFKAVGHAAGLKSSAGGEK